MELQLAAYWCLQLVKGDVHVYTCSADSDLFRPIDPTGRAQDPVEQEGSLINQPPNAHGSQELAHAGGKHIHPVIIFGQSTAYAYTDDELPTSR